MLTSTPTNTDPDQPGQKTPTKSMFKKPSRLSLPPQRITPSKSSSSSSQSSTQTETKKERVKPAWDNSVVPVIEPTRTKLKPALTPFKTRGPVNHVNQLRNVQEDQEVDYHLLYISEKQKTQKLQQELEQLRKKLETLGQ